MPPVESELALWRDPQLAALATSASPAWLWSVDGSRILWANAVGAALFGAADSAACTKRRFGADNPAAAQIARLAATLPSSRPRLERLRGFGPASGLGRAFTCACSRLPLADGNVAFLIAATEPVGPRLSLAERVRRLFANAAEQLAVFAPNGTLLYQTETARVRLGEAPSLSALGLAAIAARALETGSASCVEANIEAAFRRLGENASRVLVLILAPQPSEAVAAAIAAELGEAAGRPATSEVAPPPAAAPPDAEPPPPTPASSPPPHDAPLDQPVSDRRHPLRFVWQMDADGRFIVGSDEFIELVGPRTMAAFGRQWSEIAAELKLDPSDQLARAVGTRETWSGIVVSWPVDEINERLPVELSGLPVFDRERSYRGYRGFGVCRDIARLNQLARARRERPIGFMPIAENPPQPAEPSDLDRAAAAARQGAAAADAPVAAEAAARPERPALSIAVGSANVVPFRPGPTIEPKAPVLSPVERRAFRELAQELTARLRGTPEAVVETPIEGALAEDRHLASEAVEPAAAAAAETPVPSMEQRDAEPRRDTDDGESQTPVSGAGAAAQLQTAAPDESALLDRMPIGFLVYRHDALLYANRRFLEWTGFDTLDGLAAAGGLNSLFVEPATATLAESDEPRSLSITTRHGETLPVDGRLFAVPWHGAPALALVLANGVGVQARRSTEQALAAAETELRNAQREAQKAAAAKADFLAKVSHEIRTPLNAITGFAEVIMAERFGPIGNERYREYLKDIYGAGTHLVALLNDLLDLSKIETGRLDLTFVNVNLNDLIQQCVGIMQPQANRSRIIIRTALTPALHQVVADERSVRQIVLNLLANAIRFTGPGGQAIVSTAVSDGGEVIVRVRDTGVGMSEADVALALEPFRQTATSGSWGSGGTGLGLPLTKALAEANRAHFSIKSAPNAGTLVEITFPPSRVAAN